MNKSFLQSKEWSKFQNSLGRRTFRVNDRLVIRHGLPLGLSFLYSPRIKLPDDKKAIKKFLSEVREIANKENAIFLRLEPLNDVSMKQCGNETMKQRKCIQPQDTLILNLEKSENDLLQEMHPKTRYNIRLAEKHKIKIRKSVNLQDVDIFWHLALKTSRHDGFRYHPKRYYQKMLESLGAKKMVELHIAYLNGTMIPVAAILVLFYEETTVYLHGASDYSYRKYMAPYLLQWQAIKEAKKRGCGFYDFWGIAPNNVTMKQCNNETIDDHPWAGITRFKVGFAPKGTVVHYPDCLDIIYQPGWYWLYNLLRKSKP